MAANPIPTLAAWKSKKKEFGIPGKIVSKGEFGARIDKLSKAFDTKGGKKPTVANLADVLAVLDQALTLTDEWITKAKSAKEADFTKKKTKAVEAVEEIRDQIAAGKDHVKQDVDPLHGTKVGLPKALTFYRKALTDPSNSDGLYDLWDKGGRQYVGQGMREALKNAGPLGYDKSVVKLLNGYNTLLEKWMDIMLAGVDRKKLALDPTEREKFLNDMHKALTAASMVLKQTGH